MTPLIVGVGIMLTLFAIGCYAHDSRYALAVLNFIFPDATHHQEADDEQNR